MLQDHSVFRSFDPHDRCRRVDIRARLGRNTGELLGFPGAAFDDQVDATSQLLLWVQEKGFYVKSSVHFGSLDHRIIRLRASCGWFGWGTVRPMWHGGMAAANR
jgi:hypothetical protein